MTQHNLKTHSEYFQAVKAGLKKAELRFNDRDYKVGDRINLLELDPKTNTFTGEVLDFGEITYILYGGRFGLELGYVMFCTDYQP